MNQVPTRFLEEIAFTSIRSRSPKTMLSLSGNFSKVARNVIEKSNYRSFEIDEDKLAAVRYLDCSHMEIPAEKRCLYPSKFLLENKVCLKSCMSEKIDISLLERLATLADRFVVHIYTSHFHDKWIEFLPTWKNMTEVSFCSDFSNSMSVLLRKMVYSKQLKRLYIGSNTYNDDDWDTMSLLFTQNQFRILSLDEGDIEIVSFVVTRWITHPREMKGKSLDMKAYIKMTQMDYTDYMRTNPNTPHWKSLHFTTTHEQTFMSIHYYNKYGTINMSLDDFLDGVTYSKMSF